MPPAHTLLVPHNAEEEAALHASLGLPTLALMYGRAELRVTLNEEGVPVAAELVKRPARIVDVCTLLR